MFNTLDIKKISEQTKDKIGELINILESKGIDEEFVKETNNVNNILHNEKLVKFIETNDAFNSLTRFQEILSDTNLCNEFLEAFSNFKDSLTCKNEKYIPISENYQEEYRNKEKTVGFSLLSNELDKLTGGIMKGTLATIVGGPGSMKTTTAMNIAYKAIKTGENVCYLSLEETPFQMYSKLLSRVSIDCNVNLSAQDICQKKLNERDEDILLNQVKPYLDELPGELCIVGEGDLGNCTIDILEKKFKSIDEYIKQKNKSKTGEEGKGIGLLIVDHIQILKYKGNGTQDEFQIMNNYVSFFRQQALSFLHEKREIAVILLSQVNREGVAYASRRDGQYQMQHVAEASEIERASSYIISVYTDAMSQVSKLLKMGAVKLRGAALPISTINIFADGKYYQVGDTTIPEQEEYKASDIDMSSIQGSSDPNEPSLNEILGEFAL